MNRVLLVLSITDGQSALGSSEKPKETPKICSNRTTYSATLNTVRNTKRCHDPQRQEGSDALPEGKEAFGLFLILSDILVRLRDAQAALQPHQPAWKLWKFRTTEIAALTPIDLFWSRPVCCPPMWGGARWALGADICHCGCKGMEGRNAPGRQVSLQMTEYLLTIPLKKGYIC